MSIIELKEDRNDYTPKELIELDKAHFKLVVFGFSFSVICDEHYGSQPCFYLDTRVTNSKMLFSVGNVPDKTYRKLSVLRADIEKSLKKLKNQLQYFEISPEKAFIKYFNWDFDPSLNYQKDREKEILEKKLYLYSEPSKIISPSIKPFLGEKTFIEDEKLFSFVFSSWLDHKTEPKEFLESFSHMNLSFLKKLTNKININTFQEQTIKKTNIKENVLNILFSIN